MSWWNQAHDEHAVTVTSEMVNAYTRQVVYADKLAWFDAQLAALLTPSERAYFAQRFRSRHRPLTALELPDPDTALRAVVAAATALMRQFLGVVEWLCEAVAARKVRSGHTPCCPFGLVHPV